MLRNKYRTIELFVYLSAKIYAKTESCSCMTIEIIISGSRYYAKFFLSSN